MKFVVNIFISALVKYRWLFGPVFLILALVKTDLLPRAFNEFFIPIISIIAIVLGLPLSSALRIDQLSFRLGPEYSREFVLSVALCVAYLNLTFWLFLKRLFFPVGEGKACDREHKKKRISQKVVRQQEQKKIKLDRKK